MHYLVLISLLAASVLAYGQPEYSYSPAVGSGSGTAYSIQGEGRITAVRMWELSNNRIYGIQFRYGFIWSAVAGYKSGLPIEIELFDDEAITGISGKHNHYIYSLVFTTNMGRMLTAGQPVGTSFNMYPTNPKAELRFISGRIHSGLTSIGAHWGVVDPSSNNTGN